MNIYRSIIRISVIALLLISKTASFGMVTIANLPKPHHQWKNPSPEFRAKQAAGFKRAQTRVKSDKDKQLLLNGPNYFDTLPLPMKYNVIRLMSSINDVDNFSQTSRENYATAKEYKRFYTKMILKTQLDCKINITCVDPITGKMYILEQYKEKIDKQKMAESLLAEKIQKEHPLIPGYYFPLCYPITYCNHNIQRAKKQPIQFDDRSKLIFEEVGYYSFDAPAGISKTPSMDLNDPLFISFNNARQDANIKSKRKPLQLDREPMKNPFKWEANVDPGLIACVFNDNDTAIEKAEEYQPIVYLQRAAMIAINEDNYPLSEALLRIMYVKLQEQDFERDRTWGSPEYWKNQKHMWCELEMLIALKQTYNQQAVNFFIGTLPLFRLKMPRERFEMTSSLRESMCFEKHIFGKDDIDRLDTRKKELEKGLIEQKEESRHCTIL